MSLCYQCLRFAAHSRIPIVPHYLQEFDKYNNRNNDDDAIRPWLEGFVRDKGKAATALLKDVGDVPPKIVSLPAS